MKLKKLAEKICNINVWPGDRITLLHVDEFGKKDKVLSEEIKEDMHITKAVVFEAEDFLGMSKAIGGAFGEDKE